jgi:hypothetical protein
VHLFELMKEAFHSTEHERDPFDGYHATLWRVPAVLRDADKTAANDHNGGQRHYLFAELNKALELHGVAFLLQQLTDSALHDKGKARKERAKWRRRRSHTLPVAASPSMKTKCRLSFSRFLRICSSFGKDVVGGTGRCVLKVRTVNTRAACIRAVGPPQPVPNAAEGNARFRDFILSSDCAGLRNAKVAAVAPLVSVKENRKRRG